MLAAFVGGALVGYRWGWRSARAGPPRGPAAVPAALQATIAAEHRPLEGIIALPGLVEAQQRTRAAGARGFLHVFTGRGKGASVAVTDGGAVIGRATDATLALSDEGVSHRHAEVRPRPDGFYVRDLGSKNGTFVNDEPVLERKLAPGDIIACGDTKMLFQAL